jgi:hypothetical protein
MDNENAVESVSLLLSREELLFILNLLEAQFIPGLDPDPLGELTAEQRPLALTVAGRALRARQLAQVYADGEWILHNDLLTAVGASAYPQSVISVFHWGANADTPARYFGHIRGDDVVVHTRPEDVLHRFALLPSTEQLMAQILSWCEYEHGTAAAVLELTLPSAVFAQVRELAAAGSTAEAAELLVNQRVEPEPAQAFVDTLAHSPKVSILQTLKQQQDGTVQKQDLTLLQNGRQAWLIVASPDEAAPLRVKSTSKDELQALLAEGL